jgi:serine-type D-Ala-D-Ala carboxypeptidase
VKSLDWILELGPSAAVFAASTGEAVARGFRNLREVPQPIPVKVEDSFDLASITKIMCTTAIIMDLISDGELTLDTRISSILPKWKGAKDSITIEDLLRHRSGLEPWRPLYISQSSIESSRDFIARLDLAAPIDSVRAYSDLGFIALGEILETVTNSSLESIFNSMIAQPYSLKKTQFGKPLTSAVSTSRGDRFEYEMVASKVPYQIPESAEEFSRWRHHVLEGEISDGNTFHLFGGASSHAGLFSTAHDILKFAGQIKNHPLFATFTASGPDPEAHHGFISWTSSVAGCTDRIYGHTGFTGVAFGISSQHETEMVMLTNRTHTEGKLTLTSEMWQLVIDEYHVALHA